MIKKRFREFSNEVLKIHPWAKADTIMWKNIVSLWDEGHQVLIYSVDAPSELTTEWLEVWSHMYPCAKKNWFWWVQIYLREKIMTRDIQWILDNYKEKKEPKILVFLQSFHWDHVKFLLNNPTKDRIWNYYFGNFPEIDKQSVGDKIKNLNKVFYKYWNEISDF